MKFHWLRSWARQAVGHGVRRTGGRNKGRGPWSRPLVERLEDRTVPSGTALGIPTWTEQGPAQQSEQLYGNAGTPPDDPVAGAVESLAVNPNHPAQILIGTVDGGVWRTTSADATNPAAISWTPLSDHLASLAIGAVAYDPADATGNTFYAGTGLWSNSFDSGDSAVGLYRTTNAGATWQLLGNNASGVNVLATHRIKALAITGQTILAGTINGTGIGSVTQPGDSLRDYATLGGALFRSADGGATFSQVLPASGLPSGAVSSLVVDPNDALRVFAAVDGQGVFRSEDGGVSWTAYSSGLMGAATSADIELAVQNLGGTTLFAGVSQENEGASTQAFNGVFSATDFTGSGNWTGLAAAPAAFNPGLGFAEKFQLATDPVNAGVVYIDGQGGSGIYRYDPTGAGSWVQIDQGGAQNTSPHPDSRDLKFLNNTTLLESDDGGIYFLQDPSSAATSNWNSFNGNLANHEVYSAAYDATNRVVIEGTQDNGSPRQNAAGSLSYSDLTGGDGAFQQVDTTSLGGGNVFDYSLSDNFSFFNRNEFNNANVNINNNGLGGPFFAITNVSSGAGLITITTASTAGLLTGDGLVINGVQGNTAANGGWLITVTSATQFTLDGSSGSGTYLGGGNWQLEDAIVSASGMAGGPVVITTFIPHRLTTGDQVFILSLTGTYASLNNSNYYVTVIDATDFSLNGTTSDGTTAAGGFYSPSNQVLLKSALGAANLSGITNAQDQSVVTKNQFNLIPFALNSVDPRQMLIGLNGVYEDADTSAANGFAGDVITTITGNVGALTGVVTALVYGGQRGGTGFTNVALIGTVTGQLFFRGESGAAFTDVSAQLGTTNSIQSIAVSPRDWRQVYVVTTNQVFFTANISDLTTHPFLVIGGGPNDNLVSLSANLGSLGPEFRSLTVVGSTAVVGGLGGSYRLLTPLTGANPHAHWAKFGQGLPNDVVRSLTYDAPTDTLVAGTMGRGVWTLANASRFLNLAIIATGTQPGRTSLPEVTVRDAATGQLIVEFLAYENTFRGGDRVAVGDLNSYGIPELIVAPGPGRAALVEVFSIIPLANGTFVPTRIASFNAFSPTFLGGVYVAAGDVNADGSNDIVVGAGAGWLPQVRVYDGASVLAGSPTLIGSPFNAYENTFRGGVTVAAADFNKDGHADIVTGRASKGQPTVNVFNGVGFGLVKTFNAFSPSFLGGLWVAAGDVNGDGTPDILVGAGPGWLPEVAVFSGTNVFTNSSLAQLVSFPATSNTFRGGIIVYAIPVNGGNPGSGGQVAIFTDLGTIEGDHLFLPLGNLPNQPTGPVLGNAPLRGVRQLAFVPPPGRPTLHH